jgi:excisionase family DNA binding protein
MQKLLTISELALILDISIRTLHRMIKNEKLPFAMKLHGAWRFKESDLDRWLDTRKI